MVAQTSRHGGVHGSQQALHIFPWQGAVRACVPRLHRRNYRISQVDRDTSGGEQETGKGADAAGHVGHGRARATVRAHDQELVDIRQRHRAPSLAVSGEMFRELPNMTQLAAHGHFRIAAAPSEVIGIRTQQRRCRRPRTSRILPCRQSQTDHVVHAAERVERSARAAEPLWLEVAMPCIPSNEPVRPSQTQLGALIQVALCAVGAEAPDPLKVQARAAVLDAVVCAPDAKHVFRSGGGVCGD